MLLATILLLGAIPQSGQVARAVANAPAEAIAEASNKAAGERSLPSMPVAKSKFDAAGDGVSSSVAANVAAEAVQPPRVALSMQPVKSAYTRPRETRNQRIAWYTLAVTGHGAAAFDAYSTRRGPFGNFRREGKPFRLPSAHSEGVDVVQHTYPALLD